MPCNGPRIALEALSIGGGALVAKMVWQGIAGKEKPLQ